MIRTVQVRFVDSINNVKYDFKTDIEGLKHGDLLVCECSNGYKLVAVQEVLDKLTPKSTRWIVQKVDLDSHLERMDKERKLDEVKAKLEKRKEKLQDRMVYELLAKEDVEMAELLKEYDLLGGQA